MEGPLKTVPYGFEVNPYRILRFIPTTYVIFCLCAPASFFLAGLPGGMVASFVEGGVGRVGLMNPCKNGSSSHENVSNEKAQGC